MLIGLREFNVERHVRDARITSIYEGTSQLQIVAAYGGVVRDVLGSHFAAKELVEMYGFLHMGYLLLEDAERDERKKLIAKRFAVDALARSRKNFEAIMGNQFCDLESAGEILG